MTAAAPVSSVPSPRPEYAHPAGVEQLDPYYVEGAGGDDHDGSEVGDGDADDGEGGPHAEDDEGGEPLEAGLDGLPVFLEEPRGGWVTRDGAAAGTQLRCRAAHALRAHISCGGRRLAARTGSFVDPQSGVRVVELEASAPRGEVSCRCHAWSGRGHVRSRTARLHLACMYTLH